MGIVSSPVCDRVRSQVSLELDGELSNLERLMVARHLERCADCREFRVGVVELTDAVRNSPLETMGRPIVLPRPRRAQLAAVRAAVLQVGAAAAGIAIVLGLALGERDTFATERPKARPAYADSPSAEARMIRELSAYRLAQARSHVRAV